MSDKFAISSLGVDQTEKLGIPSHRHGKGRVLIGIHLHLPRVHRRPCASDRAGELQQESLGERPAYPNRPGTLPRDCQLRLSVREKLVGTGIDLKRDNRAFVVDGIGRHNFHIIQTGVDGKQIDLNTAKSAFRNYDEIAFEIDVVSLPGVPILPDPEFGVIQRGEFPTR